MPPSFLYQKLSLNKLSVLKEGRRLTERALDATLKKKTSVKTIHQVEPIYSVPNEGSKSARTCLLASEVEEERKKGSREIEAVVGPRPK